MLLQDMIEAITGKQTASADARGALQEGFAKVQQRVAPVLNKLSPSDRSMLAQLTLFPDKFSLAAAAVAMGMPENKAQQQLLRLSRRALVLTCAESSNRLQHHYKLHLLIREMGAVGFQQSAAFLSAQQRLIQHHISMLQSAEYYFAVNVGTGYTFAQLAAESSSFIRIFQYLSQQQNPPGVDRQSINIIKQLCSLGQPALQAITDLGLGLGLDDTLVTRVLRNLVKWCHHPAVAKQLKSSAISAEEQLGFYLASRWQRPCEARQHLKTALKARRAEAAAQSFSLVLPLLGMAQAESAISCSSSRSPVQCELAKLRAHACLTEAFAILKQSKGMQDPYTIDCLWMAASFVNSNDSRAKYAASRDLIHFSRLSLGHRHALTLSMMSSLADNLAEFALDDDEADEAVQLARDWLEAVSDTGDISSTIEASTTLAEALLQTHNHAAEQEGVLKMLQAASLQDREYGPASVESLELRLDQLVPALIQARRYDQVIEVILQDRPLYDRFDSAHGCASFMRILSTQWLADAYCGKGDLATAEDHLRALLAKCSSRKIMEEFGPAGKADVAMRLACVSAQQGR